MNVKELKEILEKEKIPSKWYSINSYLGSDTYILREVESNYWEFFYMDERGGQNNDLHIFGNENDACEYMLKCLLNEKKYNNLFSNSK